MILYDPAFGMPLLGSSNCGCQKIYKAVLLRVTTYVYWRNNIQSRIIIKTPALSADLGLN